ncbi:hypothetical protein KCU88_g85, partial [Aureobasidium melanogenum]
MGRLSRQPSGQQSVEEAAVGVKREESVEGEPTEEARNTNVAALKQENSAKPSDLPSSDTLQRIKSHSPSSSQSVSPQQLFADTEDSPVSAKKESEEPDANGHTSPSASPVKLEAKEAPKPTKSARGAASKLPPRVAPLKNGQNLACGDDSDCINRACKMECAKDCGCGPACQNQRFLRRLWANVSVIKTEKKGYGLRTNVDLRPHDFIFEYIGETIPENTFRKRMRQYDEEGIKHFYFMSLSKGEFIDATKKGNLGRFCNHSCNPNCYVDKWVVGDKLRMGIFAERYIKAGEELVFNYNVDRYGADPQPCYCGESNCTGFIGGKTQTERGTKLSAATIEALGIDEADSWETTVARRPRKKKVAEDDEDYVDSLEAKSLDADSVTKVMAALMQCKEKWIAVKLLQRIQRCEDDQAWHKVVRFHGYQILNSQLAAWRDDENIILQILDILNRLPRLTRNKIVDAKIDKTLEPLTQHPDERVASQASQLLDAWSKLELAYRIPRKKRTDASNIVKPQPTPFERRESAQERKRSKSRSRSRSRTPPRGPTSVPSGPKSLQRPAAKILGRALPSFTRPPPPLPRGWFAAQDNGRTYYYSTNGQTTWSRPTKPADEPPPPPKQPSEQDLLKSIIDNIVTSHDKEKQTATPDTPKPVKVKKEEKWKSYNEEKQKKLYENTLFPLISHVMNKYKNKIPRDDLKRFAKEVAKKLVASDYKAGRVKDPTKIEEKQQKKVKEFCKQFFEKAYQKHKKHEADKAARQKSKKGSSTHRGEPSSSEQAAASSSKVEDVSPADEDDEAEDVKMSISDDEDADNTPSEQTPIASNGTAEPTLKRKRAHDNDSSMVLGDEEEEEPTGSPMKRLNLDVDTPTTLTPPPPPPPPPAPPAETPPDSTPREGEAEAEMDMDIETEPETDIHADTNFKGKSMADVLAQAQQEDDGDEGVEEANGDTLKAESDNQGKKDGVNGIGTSAGHGPGQNMELDNPLVEGQEFPEETR